MNHNKISDVTRRNITDHLRINRVHWSGALDEVAFLRRLYDLDTMSSTDFRREYNTAALDIWKHRVNNRDWDNDWVYCDPRFKLMDGSDESFLRFLCEMVHPAVRGNKVEVSDLVNMFNDFLLVDGWQIIETEYISERPVYEASQVDEAPSLSVKAARKLSEQIESNGILQQITRIEKALLSDDTPLAIGTAKEFVESICKTILIKREIDIPSGIKFVHLVRTTMKQLDLLPEEHNNRVPTDTFKTMMMNLACLSDGIALLRNRYGTGHGRESEATQLPSSHAKLIVHAATTLGVFLHEIADA